MEIEDAQELAAMRLMWAEQSPESRKVWRSAAAGVMAFAVDRGCPNCGASGSDPCVIPGSERRTPLLRQHRARMVAA